MVDVKTGKPLSPFYAPTPALMKKAWNVWELDRHHVGDAAARAMPLPPIPAWQQTAEFSPKAVSAPGRVPQGYLSQHLAMRACEAAGKRLCTESEWVRACRGRQNRQFPYGAAFQRRQCNVYRFYHPAFILHGDSSIGHRDPRLNLVKAQGKDPVLRLTAATETCVSDWGDEGALYDMVGNLDEWVADESGVFVGGFYARASTKGCESKVSGHRPSYYDYSLGTRCCRDFVVEKKKPPVSR